MKINDIIWGKVKVDDENIMEVISHPAFQRLKNIYISGYGYLFELKRNSTRFEHSIGAYLLLKKFGANFTEQVAGLIHDISHTAFSHLSTYALQGKYVESEFHEVVKKKFIFESGLAEILEKMDLDIDFITESHNFSLLDNNLPDICADRIDYAIRDGLYLQILSKQQANKIIEGLEIFNNSFVFSNPESAFLYSFAFYLLNLQHYGSASEAFFNNDFGNLIKLAIKKGVLSDEDWFSDDVKVVEKLKNSSDSEIKAWLNSYNHNLTVFEDSENYHFIYPKKIRIVDPPVLIGGNLKRLTEIDSVYSKILTDYKKTHQKHELPIKVFRKE